MMTSASASGAVRADTPDHDSATKSLTPTVPERLGGLIRPVRGRLIAGTVLAFVGAAVGLMPYVAVTEIARLLLSPGADEAAAWRWALLGAAGAAIRAGMMITGSLMTHYADADLQRHTRVRLARHMAVVPLGWFQGRGSGELKKATDDDVEDMHHLVAHAVPDMANALGLPLAAVAYLTIIDWRMTLITVSLLPLAMLAIGRAHRTMPARMQELMSAQGQINNATIEYVDGIEVVKAYGQGGRTYTRFTSAVDDFCNALAAWTADAGRAMFSAHALLSPVSVLLVVLGSGLWFVSAGWLTAVDLLPFLLVGVGLPTPFMTLVQGTQQLRKATMAAGHVGSVLSEPPVIEPESPRSPSVYDVVFDRVSFAYDDTTAVLHDFSASCRQGALTAVVGPSGSGKTTLTRLIPRFFDVTAGEIRIGGIDTRRISTTELLSCVSVVFQDVVLVRDTIRENIRLGRPAADDAAVEAAARAARIHREITALPAGYDTIVDGRAGVLSGGQRQRLTIARAILQDAPIVLLDEATAFVDPENELAVQTALAELTRDCTVIVVAHRLRTIVDADQILVLDRGRLAERGTHEQLLTKGARYAAMWAAQSPPEGASTSEEYAGHGEER